jgi:hypothetical protein
MNIFDDDLKHLLRKHAGRWGKLLDTLNTLKSYDNGWDTVIIRLLSNGFRKSTYVSEVRDTLETDRVNAIRALPAPLAEAIGHILTIECADAGLKRLSEVEQERVERKHDLQTTGSCEEHRDFIAVLHERGVSRGHFRTLSPEHINAIASYILRKHAKATGYRMPLRSAKETRLPNGRRAHRFWDPYVPLDLPPEGF